MPYRLVHRLLYWLPAAAWAGMVFFLSSRPAPRPPEGWDFFAMDKYAHAGIFAILALFVLAGLQAGWRRASVGTVLLAVVIASLYGATDELHQHFLPFRQADPLDWAADTLGAALLFLANRFLPPPIARPSA